MPLPPHRRSEPRQTERLPLSVEQRRLRSLDRSKERHLIWANSSHLRLGFLAERHLAPPQARSSSVFRVAQHSLSSRLLQPSFQDARSLADLLLQSVAESDVRRHVAEYRPTPQSVRTQAPRRAAPPARAAARSILSPAPALPSP